MKPHASRRSARVERLSVLEETLSVFVEQRCKRFDVVEPLASRPSAFAERPSELEETLSAFVERLSVLEETLSAFVEQRCERFDVVKPLASRPSARAERLSVLEETLSAFVERLSALEETLSAFAEQRCKRFDDGEPTRGSPRQRRRGLRSGSTSWIALLRTSVRGAPGFEAGSSARTRVAGNYLDSTGTVGRQDALAPCKASCRPPVPLRQAKPGRGGSHVASRNLSK